MDYLLGGGGGGGGGKGYVGPPLSNYWAPPSSYAYDFSENTKAVALSSVL